MNMRNIHNDEPSKKTDKGRAWAEEWNKSQKHAENPITVIYGHDARRVFSFFKLCADYQGLQIRKHTKGLDTSCVRGGKLTALIYPGEELVSVECEKYWG